MQFVRFGMLAAADVFDKGTQQVAIIVQRGEQRMCKLVFCLGVVIEYVSHA